MNDTVRFGISITEELLNRFDKLVQQKNYSSRSEALRDLIRQELVQQEWINKGPVVGVITLVYDHHFSNLTDKLIQIQHTHHNLILTTTHIHLDHTNCLEILAVKGNPRKIQQLSSELTSQKGVKHGKLTATSTGENLV